MKTDPKRGKMLTVRDGYLICPRCRNKKVKRILPSTTATDDPVFRRQCKWEAVIDVDMGQCYLSQSH